MLAPAERGLGQSERNISTGRVQGEPPGAKGKTVLQLRSVLSAHPAT